MTSASFLFSAVFRFRKVTQEIFSELHRAKTPSIFSRHVHGDRRRDGEGPWSPHTTWRRGSHPRHAGRWCGAHRPPPGSALRPYIPLQRKTLSTRSKFHEKFHRCHRHQPKIGRVLELFLAPCRRGDHHWGALHHHACLRSDA